MTERASRLSTGELLQQWGLPLTEVLAAALLAAALFLPWFEVTYPGLPNGPRPSSVSWVDWKNVSANLWDLLVPLGVLLSLIAALARVIWQSRWARIAILVSFAVAGAAALWIFSRLTSLFYPPDSATSAGIGLWVFAIVASVGVVLSLLDLVGPSKPKS